MKKYIIIATMLMLSVPTLVGCGKEKVSTKGGASANATQKIASGENLTIPVKEISEKASFYSVEVDGTQMEVIAVLYSWSSHKYGLFDSQASSVSSALLI